MIIRETHLKQKHAGIQTTLYAIRQRYWILDGRNQVRKILRACIRCFRFRVNEIQYMMAKLPKSRVNVSRPFENVGMDFCGPFHIKEKKYRNRAFIKVYVCVFICMSVKAVHLEVVGDMTTDGFLAAFRRFISRRGVPKNCFSDNGLNFVGAKNDLEELYNLLNSDEHKTEIEHFSIDHKIKWNFIPPLAPHFGGLWESTVKQFKHHFKRVAGNLTLNFEELNTLVTEIEAILNSRPLTPLSSDPNDIVVLSPAHCLIGQPMTKLPESDWTTTPSNRLSVWQHITKVRQHFWQRWRLEYLNELQQRQKWTKGGSNLEVGTLVLLKDRNAPCMQWPMGRVTEIHPGDDGIVRTATVKTATGESKRSVKLLSVLPIEKDSD
ncbi:uncharacterized protein LOC135168629 [Diachasmimorpha longicaudata]|uniref:uncharacterized protein LOC135168629 n=1 Tax=Diachasmimorpha longicaudata TaxID=58733 RepID=UPI0030B8CCE3